MCSAVGCGVGKLECVVTKRGIDRLRAEDYRAALRRAASPSDVERIVREVADIARTHEDHSQRLVAASMLVQWTAGRAHQASAPVDPLELPEVRSVPDALEALAKITSALGRGEIDGHSAKVYSELVCSAAKLAAAESAVDALAGASRLEWTWTDEVPVEEQLPALARWLASQGPLAGSADEESEDEG